MRILVTGARGLVGSNLIQRLLKKEYEVIGVDRRKDSFVAEKYRHYEIDLSDSTKFQEIVTKEKPDRVIHLAALAHRKGQSDLSWERYYQVNVQNAINVFQGAGDVPVLFISTVDVFGFTKGVVTVKTVPRPVTNYGKTKLLAEKECMRLCKYYDIFRLSPIYTKEVKRDIQKRYYLRYPNIAYQIGKGSEYEILNIDNAVMEMVEWCSKKPCDSIRIIKDDKKMWTPDYIAAERKIGNAKMVLYFPKWLVFLGFHFLMLTGKNKYTYLLNKAVYPLRSE